MVFSNFIDATLNVCRSASDILHILCYLLLVVVASLFAFYKFDNRAYQRHITKPIFKMIFKNHPKFGNVVTLHYVNFRNRHTSGHWESMSTRVPYIAKSLKNFIVDSIKSFK